LGPTRFFSGRRGFKSLSNWSKFSGDIRYDQRKKLWPRCRRMFTIFALVRAILRFWRHGFVPSDTEVLFF
jgi:hypothetical protein